LSKKAGKIFLSIRNFEFKFNACMHNTINEFGFHKLSFQAIVFILACVRSVCEEDLDEALNEYT